jgi:hypothetical protein
VENKETYTREELLEILGKDAEIESPKAFLAAIDRYREEAKTFREERDAYKKQIDESTAGEEIKKWRSRSVRTDAIAALREKGYANADRLLSFMDLDSLDYDDKDTLVGLDDQLKAVQDKLPELFDVRKAVGGAADSKESGKVSAQSDDPLKAQIERALSRAPR